MKRRSSGVLLHITSLPGEFGVGDLGPEAYRFADRLARARQGYWQVLPLNAITARGGYSPYNCLSAFAGNRFLISPELLYKNGLLTSAEFKDHPRFAAGRVDYNKVSRYKDRLLELCADRAEKIFKQDGFQLFRAENEDWLRDYAIFMALRKRFKGKAWSQWPAKLRDRNTAELASVSRSLRQQIDRHILFQYLFFRQWDELKQYCNRKGIKIFGDMPVYVTFDSVDVWARPEIFKLRRDKRPRFVSGVPPDYFSRTGQLWGNPIYDWQVLKDRDYDWWVRRMQHNLRLFDVVRIDHFRGFIAYWQVPAGHRTALRGKWVQGPGEDFFRVLLKHIPFAPIIAEDLGYITADVREAIAKFELPGMRVLQFAFGEDPGANLHSPHNHVENCVVYTGTHDNNTTRGWFTKELSAPQKRQLYAYIGRKTGPQQVSREMIRLAMSSVARLAIIPAQDLLSLGASARMNRPARKTGNWRWRMKRGQLTAAVMRKLKKFTRLYGRS